LTFLCRVLGIISLWSDHTVNIRLVSSLIIGTFHGGSLGGRERF
jgi:uncharacterized membrane protein YfcA